jgi:2-desacetyl-2-hydroxyethyl bacteriochlorophyllide A dehydrogenase
MRAMVLEAFGAPLVLRERPTPEPGPGEVLVKVEACGVCGTDLKVTAGKLADVRTPVVPGHEVAGVVAALGDGVEGVRPGQRVTCYYYVSCGRCRNCRSGRETICLDLKGRVGFTRDGGFAEYLVVPAENVLPIPDGMTFEDAAVLEDAVATPYHALVTRGGLVAGETVLIMGCGGLGIHALQVAKSAGAHVIAVDIDPSHLEEASRHGADATVLYDPAGYRQAVRALARDGVDMVVETVTQPETIRLNAEVLIPGGRLVLIGYTPGLEVSLETSRTVLSELTVVPSRASGRHEVARAVELVARGAVRPVIAERMPLTEANRALDLLRQGKVLGRAVLLPA